MATVNHLSAESEKTSTDPRMSLEFVMEQEASHDDGLERLLEELVPDDPGGQQDIVSAWLEVCLYQKKKAHYDSLTAKGKLHWLTQFIKWKSGNGPPPASMEQQSPPHTPEPSSSDHDDDCTPEPSPSELEEVRALLIGAPGLSPTLVLSPFLNDSVTPSPPISVGEKLAQCSEATGLLDELCCGPGEQELVSKAWMELHLTQGKNFHYWSLSPTERRKWMAQFARWKLWGKEPSPIMEPLVPYGETLQVTEQSVIRRMWKLTHLKEIMLEAVMEVGMEVGTSRSKLLVPYPAYLNKYGATLDERIVWAAKFRKWKESGEQGDRPLLPWDEPPPPRSRLRLSRFWYIHRNHFALLRSPRYAALHKRPPVPKHTHREVLWLRELESCPNKSEGGCFCSALVHLGYPAQLAIRGTYVDIYEKYGVAAARVFLASMVVPDPTKDNTLFKVPYFLGKEGRCFALFLCRRQFQYLFGLHDSRMARLSRIARCRHDHTYYVKTKGGKSRRGKHVQDANRNFVWCNGNYELPDRTYNGFLCLEPQSNPSSLYRGIYRPVGILSWEELEKCREYLPVSAGPGEPPRRVPGLELYCLAAIQGGQYPYHRQVQGKDEKTH